MKMEDNNFGVSVPDDGYTHDQRIAITQMQDKMIMNYLSGNIAPAPVQNNDIVEKLDLINERLNPVNKFFNNIQKKTAPSKLSKEEKQAIDEEAMEAAMKAKAMKKLSKKG